MFHSKWFVDKLNATEGCASVAVDGVSIYLVFNYFSTKSVEADKFIRVGTLARS
jgi:hypothetical protein